MRPRAGTTGADAAHWHSSLSDVERDVLVACCLTDRLDDQSIRAAGALLSPDERARRDRLARPGDRRDFAVAHALLRRTLSLFGGRAPHEWTFVPGAAGKPSIDASPGERASRLSFNLTHCDGLVACIVALDAAVGVDAEVIDSRIDVMAMARDFLAREEIEALEQCAAEAQAARFVEIWTLKEAYVKALGHGLSLPLDGFAFIFEGTEALRVIPEEGGMASAWACALFAPTSCHRMAVAIRGAAAGRRLVVSAVDPTVVIESSTLP
jgi:4'-phosphopantetheinyl transferase